MTIRTDFNPVAFLTGHGFSAHQETSPTHGYSAPTEPEIAFGHWTASAPGSDTSKWCVQNRHYASCTNRAAHTAFGGYLARQAHGGTGRLEPLTSARNGEMSPMRWARWNASPARDDTGTWPNRYGMSFAIDCTINENVSTAQADAWLAVGAMWLSQSGLDARYSLFHSTSTARKVDVDSLLVDGVRWGPDRLFDRLQHWVAKFSTPTPPVPGPPVVEKEPGVFAIAQWPDGDGYVQVKPDGGVYAFKAPFLGSAHGLIRPGAQAVDVAWTPVGDGYWVVASDGDVYSFGNAPYKGNVTEVLPAGAILAAPVTSISAERDGQGYYLSTADGGVFAFGSARYYGSIREYDQKKGVTA